MKTLVSLLFLSVAGVCLMLQLPGQCEGKHRSPIVIIPGIMGSRLQIKYSKQRRQKGFCLPKISDIWVKPTKLICKHGEELKLYYHKHTNSFVDNPNAKIIVPDFGQTSSVEYLNPDGWFSKTRIEYMHDLVKYFVKKGYVRGETIRAAPYDWRLAADELERTGYYLKLKELIEDMYKKTNTKVTLVVHSMGGPVSLHFLTGYKEVKQAWKDKHINAYVTLSGAWSGGVAALETVISGTTKVTSFKSYISKKFVPIVRTFESLPWLFPRSSVFGNRALISTPSRQYTANDYSKLFSDVGYDRNHGYQTYKRVQSINPDFPTPNVPTYCYYGIHVKTPIHYDYKKNFNHDNTIGMKPKVTYAKNGDGTVNIESLKVCHRWLSMRPKYLFSLRQFTMVDHDGIVKNKRVLEAISGIVIR